MPRSRRVDPAFRHEHRPDQRERPWVHSLGWTREQVSLVNHNVRVRDREQAIEDARSAGSIVRVPPGWSTPGRTLPPANAHRGTAYLRLPPLQLEPMPLTEALDARRPLVTRPVARGREAADSFVELHRRWTEHDRAMQRSTSGALEARVAGGAVGAGAVVAIATATSGSARARVSSTHVVRIEELVDGRHAKADAARTAAELRLASGEERALLAIVRSDAGVRVARLTSASLGTGAGEPLVDSVAASGTTLGWRAATTALVAIVGLDGVRWFE